MASTRRHFLSGAAGLALGLGAIATDGLVEAKEEGTAMRRAMDGARDRLVYSTLFTAQNVNALLKDDADRQRALAFCRDIGISKVYIESFRGGYAREELLVAARDFYRKQGLAVSGCVTTVSFGKKSTGWNLISCYTNGDTQAKLEEIFRFTARLFDEIMIDDFLFTDCECEECQAARGGRSWEEYRLALMLDVSEKRILEPSHQVNPRCKVIIKYPQWYDNFHNRGYGVDTETAAFDRIWVGTETRNPTAERWGAKQQYEAYFIYRWLSGIGGPKTGGGWFDTYDCSPEVYVEQAYQTVLAGAPEVFLFNYGDISREANRPLMDRLKAAQPQLAKLAQVASIKPLRGVAAYKPVNSHPDGEDYIFDYIGMLGIPLVPTHRFPGQAKSAFLSMHALKDRQLPAKLAAYLKRGGNAIITSNLAKRLASEPALSDVPGLAAADQPTLSSTPWAGTLVVLPAKPPFTSLYQLPQEELNRVRNAVVLPAAGVQMNAPPRVALYVFGNRELVVENFADEPADVELRWGSGEQGRARITLAPHTVRQVRR